MPSSPPPSSPPQGARIGILCGGQSGEHEVSLRSALSIYRAMEQPRFRPFLIAMDKSGQWRWGAAEDLLLHPDDAALVQINPQAKVVLPFPQAETCLFGEPATAKGEAIDAFFPLIHGTDGEDGSLQGMLRLWRRPFVGSDVLGSALGMDKGVMKTLVQQAGIAVAPWETFHAIQPALSHCEAHFRENPHKALFVKPVNLGSSVGISKLEAFHQAAAALKEAFSYDEEVLIEHAIEGRELECSVLGNRFGQGAPPRASRCGEIITHHSFYSYEAKYLDPDGARLAIPAELSAEAEQALQQVAIDCFEALHCDGLARVDFFLDSLGKIWINEINTLPGFTPISMYPKLWETSGLSYSSLISELIMLAYFRHHAKQKIKRNLNSA